MSYRNFRRVWDRGVARAGMSDVVFSDLRKSHVAWLRNVFKWSDARIIARMGWKDGRMLNAVYGPRHQREYEDMSDLGRAWTKAAATIRDGSRPPGGLRVVRRESGAAWPAPDLLFYERATRFELATLTLARPSRRGRHAGNMRSRPVLPGQVASWAPTPRQSWARFVRRVGAKQERTLG